MIPEALASLRSAEPLPSHPAGWDRAAAALARYRIEYQLPAAAGGALGPEPAGGEQRRARDRRAR
jgi:hypothetical protein